MAIKCVIGDPKSGKTKQVVVDNTSNLSGKVIGDKVTLEHADLAGYEFQITGGSDSAGFPMRFDVDVPKKRLLLHKGVGQRKNKEGRRVRKMVAGRAVGARTAQLNLKIVTYGSKPMFEEKKEESKEGEQ